MTAYFQPRLADAHLTSTFDALNMCKIRHQNIWVCLRSSQFLHLEIQAFLDHSCIANFYRHWIEWYIICINFWKKFFWQKSVTSSVTWISRMSHSNFGFRTNEESSVPIFMFLHRAKVSYTFFQLTFLTTVNDRKDIAE